MTFMKMKFCSDWINIESMAAKIKKCMIFGKCAISEYSPSLLWHNTVSNPLFLIRIHVPSINLESPWLVDCLFRAMIWDNVVFTFKLLTKSMFAMKKNIRWQLKISTNDSFDIYITLTLIFDNIFVYKMSFNVYLSV